VFAAALSNMHGPLIAEFSTLNSLSQKNAVAGFPQEVILPVQAPLSAREPRSRLHKGISGGTAKDGFGSPSSAHAEVATRLMDDDLPFPAFGVPSILPLGDTADNHEQILRSLGVSASQENRERLLRRLDVCAKAREESTKIMGVRFAQRDAVKGNLRRERQLFLEKLTTSQRNRDERWGRKLQRSPFAVDLVAENQRIDEEHRVRAHVEQRRRRWLMRRDREAQDDIIKRATADTDEIDKLRAEKRMLMEHEKQLNALSRVERSNARTAEILQKRKEFEMKRLTQQQQREQQKA